MITEGSILLRWQFHLNPQSFKSLSSETLTHFSSLFQEKKKRERERERERERKLALTWNESVARDIPAKRLEHSATMGENRWISSERVSIKDDRYLRSPGAACKRALYAIASGYDDNCKATLISTCLPVEQHPAVYATSETRGPEVAGLHGAAPIRTSAY